MRACGRCTCLGYTAYVQCLLCRPVAHFLLCHPCTEISDEDDGVPGSAHTCSIMPRNLYFLVTLACEWTPVQKHKSFLCTLAAAWNERRHPCNTHANRRHAQEGVRMPSSAWRLPQGGPSVCVCRHSHERACMQASLQLVEYRPMEHTQMHGPLVSRIIYNLIVSPLVWLEQCLLASGTHERGYKA